MSDDRFRDFAEFRPPLPVKDGLRVRSRRGAIGETWWSRRFLAALEDYYATTESRLERGRRYARAGQTIELTLEPGIVRALVQGSRPTPYSVTLRIRVLRAADWRRVEAVMAGRAVFLARLLSGEMPDEIEEAFAVVDLSLFPTRRGDLRTTCSCPDTANPCKHIAAVFYLLAESFDADPFRMFEWRGRSRDSLIAELRSQRPAAGRRRDEAAVPRRPTEGPSGGVDLERFWNGGPGWAEVRIEQRPTSPADAVLRELPAGTAALLGPDAPPALRAIYLAAARAARARLDPGGEASSTRGSRRARRAPPARGSDAGL